MVELEGRELVCVPIEVMHRIATDIARGTYDDMVPKISFELLLIGCISIIIGKFSLILGLIMYLALLATISYIKL